MKKLCVTPDGWPCRFAECPPGPFVFQDTPCFKSEYGQDAYVESGEAFWGGALKPEERAELIVQPCRYEWIDED